MKKILTLYKKLGETPLECLNRFKKTHPEYKELPMTYAGRLDPMAEGLLLVLAGDKAKEKEKFTDLNKEYEFEVILGAETDTGDLLGVIHSSKTKQDPQNSREISFSDIGKLKGKFLQEYPVFSSRTVKGIPLWQLARENKLKDIEIPKKEINIRSIKYLSSRKITKDKLEKEILKRINLVTGDFRQDKIKKAWIGYFKKSKNKQFVIYKFKVQCSSGTYIRSLVQRIGGVVGASSCVFSIKRTKVGNYVKIKP